MKTILFLFCLFISQLSLAADPSTFCNQDDNECTEQMKEITKLFAIGNSDFAQLDVSGYSGVCYHLNFQYDPEMAHHGAFVFEKNQKGLTVVGAFSFFAGTDPYAGMSIADMKSQLLTVMTEPAQMSSLQDPVSLNFDSSDTGITYWFRSLRSTGELIVIGKEAHLFTLNRVFCKMQNHSSR
jgi:hypothetical protein